jgi:hypothetical protein
MREATVAAPQATPEAAWCPQWDPAPEGKNIQVGEGKRCQIRGSSVLRHQCGSARHVVAAQTEVGIVLIREVVEGGGSGGDNSCARWGDGARSGSSGGDTSCARWGDGAHSGGCGVHVVTGGRGCGVHVERVVTGSGGCGVHVEHVVTGSGGCGVHVEHVVTGSRGCGVHVEHVVTGSGGCGVHAEHVVTGSGGCGVHV